MEEKELLRPLKIEEVRLGLIVYFEYEHNFNSRSRDMRYKKATWLNFIDGKDIIYIHGNKTSNQCDTKRLYVKESDVKSLSTFSKEKGT